jgi:3-isopropylmalate/(R)-2-methylmalate dehydratase small subunit
LNNGLLPLQVSPGFLKKIFTAINIDPSEKLHVDLENQLIKITSTGVSEKFEIDPYKKNCMINGYDDIDFLVSRKEAIQKFEEKTFQF